MKNMKISLLAAGATLALLACSSLEVDNPSEENFPADWSVVEYIKVNPDLRALQIMDQVAIWNASKGYESDEEAFLADTALMTNVALNYAGFTESGLDFADNAKMKYLKAFNMYGVSNEPEVFETLTLDSAVFEKQFVAYGTTEGRPYRTCKDTETQLVKKGDCQASESASYGFKGHLYCSNAGVIYCIDCELADECPVIDVPVTESSSSAAAPESSETAGDESSSSEGEGGETADSSSSEGGENPESSDASADSSSSEEATAESSSSAE